MTTDKKGHYPYVSFDKNDGVTPHVSFDKNDSVTPCISFHDDQRKTTESSPVLFDKYRQFYPLCLFHDST
jgi:hypothetical protein